MDFKDKSLNGHMKNSSVVENFSRSPLTCFNCLGGHHLQQCPVKHDSQRIAENRKEFRKIKSRKNSSNFSIYSKNLLDNKESSNVTANSSSCSEYENAIEISESMSNIHEDLYISYNESGNINNKSKIIKSQTEEEMLQSQKTTDSSSSGIYSRTSSDDKESLNVTTDSSPFSNNKNDTESVICIDDDDTSFEDSGSIINISYFTTPVTKSNTEEKTPESGKMSAVTCFNCLGDHHLKQCPIQHDGRRIAKNRREFNEQYMQTRRYHDELSPLVVSSSKKFFPGVLSDKLRHALRLKSNQLPQYIYNMRILGYPPGWLKEAEIEPSGIMLFDSENEVQRKSTVCQLQRTKQYDFSKFFKYPGFNCPLPPGIYDQHKELRMPPMQNHQMLNEVMKLPSVIKTASNIYKSRKLFPEEETGKQIKDISSEDPSPSMVTTKTKSTSKSDEEKSNVSENIDMLYDSTKKKSNERKRTSKAITDEKNYSPSCSIPIIETPNKYKKLPCISKFSEGISDHEHFENLPNATGTYNLMRNILQTVREKLCKDNLE